MNSSNGQFGFLSNQSSSGQNASGNYVPAPHLMGPPTPAAATRPLPPQQVPIYMTRESRLRQALQPPWQPAFFVPTSSATNNNQIPGAVRHPQTLIANQFNLSAAEKLIQCQEIQKKNSVELTKALCDVLKENSTFKRQLGQQKPKIAQLEKTNRSQRISQWETEQEVTKLQSEKSKIVEDSSQQIDELNFQLQEQRKIGLLNAQLFDTRNAQAETLTETIRKLTENAAIQTNKLEELEKQSCEKERELMQANAELRQQVILLEDKEKNHAQELESERAQRGQLQLKLTKQCKMIKDWTITMRQTHQQKRRHFETVSNFEEHKLNELQNIVNENDAAVITTSNKRKMNTVSESDKGVKTLEERVQLTTDMARARVNADGEQGSNQNSVETSGGGGSQTCTPGLGSDGDDNNVPMGQDDDSNGLVIDEQDEENINAS